MIQNIDFLIRMIAIGAGLILIAQFVAGEIREKIKFPLVAMIIGVIAYLINQTAMMPSDGPLDPWLDLISISVPFSIWLFGRNLFEREPEKRFVLIAVSALLIGWFIGHFVPSGQVIGFYALHLVGLVLIADLVRVGVFERDDDLVEQRRIVRLWLPLLVAAQAGGILAFETIAALTGNDRSYPIIDLINAVLILTIMLFAGLALLRTDPELLIETQQDAASEDEGEALDLSPSEQVLHEKLIAAMNDGTYRETGLSIAGLAAHLDTPEHRLRALINGQLGYRNFSAFLNRHRIAEAKQQLADREQVDLPVLTIAMDLGYNSLPTFNRAFRTETGTTPTDYRRNAIGEVSFAEPVESENAE